MRDLPNNENRTQVTKCRCCNEVEAASLKNSEAVAEGLPQCITDHPGFQTVCLNRWMLQTAWYQYKQQYEHPEQVGGSCSCLSFSQVQQGVCSVEWALRPR